MKEKLSNTHKSNITQKDKWMLWLALFVAGSQLAGLILSVIMIAVFIVGFLVDGLVDGGSDNVSIPVYEIGDSVNVRGLKVQVEEFRYPEEKEVYSTEVDDGELVVLKIKVENESDRIMMFRTYNMVITDSSGRIYNKSFEVQSDYGFSGGKLPSGSYDEGLISFTVEDAESEFVFHYNGSVESDFRQGDVIFDIDLGSVDGPKEVVPLDDDDIDAPEAVIEGEELDVVGGIEETTLENGDIRYRSDFLRFSIDLPDDIYVYNPEVDDNCLSFGSVFSIGHSVEPGNTEGFYSCCFSSGFGSIDRLESSIEPMNINGKTYNVKVEKLISDQTGIVPETAVIPADVSSMAFFHVVLRGDVDDPTGEEYLAVEYYDSWWSWMDRKDEIKEWLSTIEVED